MQTWSMDWDWICMWKLGDSRRLLCTSEVELWQQLWAKLLQPFCWDKSWKNCKKDGVFCLLLEKEYCRQSLTFDAFIDWGGDPLPLCRNCFGMNIKFPATMWRGNIHQNRDKSKHTKNRQLETLVASGKRKCRKRSLIVFWGIYHTHCLKVVVKYSLHVIVVYCCTLSIIPPS